MRIHTDHLGYSNLSDAVRRASDNSGALVTLEKFASHGSRSHARAYDVTLTGDGTVNRRRINAGTSRTVDRFSRPYAASFDQWGWFLAHLFTVDPGAQVGSAGSPVYRDAADFHQRTGMRYTDFDGYRYTARETLREGTSPRLLTV